MAGSKKSRTPANSKDSKSNSDTVSGAIIGIIKMSSNFFQTISIIPFLFQRAKPLRNQKLTITNESTELRRELQNV